MSNRRSILWLVFLSLALAAANVAVISRGGSAVTSRMSLADPSDEYSSITIERRGRRPTVLKKTSSWRIVEPYSGSADERVVMRLVDALSLAPVDDRISDAELLARGRTRADYDLDPPSVKISLSGRGASETIGFGAMTPASNGVYAVVEGESTVFVVSTNVVSAADLPAEGFRRRSLFDIGAEAVAAFDVKSGTGSLTSFVREGDMWNVGGTPALASKVKEFVSSLVSSEAVDFIWPVGATNEEESVSSALLSVYGLDPESAVTITLKSADGIDRQISFGKSFGESLAYALVQNAGAVVTVPAALRDAAVRGAIAFTDARIFPFDESTVTSFTVADGDVQYVVARGEGDSWRLDSPVAAPADASTAKAILGKILSLSSADVRDEGLKVSVSTNSAPVTVEARRVLGNASLADLRSREILKIDPLLVRRIVSNANGAAKPSAVVYRRDLREWKTEDVSDSAAVDQSGVEKVLSAINPLRAVRVVALKVSAADLAGYGLEDPFLTIAVDQDAGDGVRRNILLGGKTSGGRFATVGSSDAVFVISSSDVESLSARLHE